MVIDEIARWDADIGNFEDEVVSLGVQGALDRFRPSRITLKHARRARSLTRTFPTSRLDVEDPRRPE
jgi:hypothetical protein